MKTAFEWALSATEEWLLLAVSVWAICAQERRVVMHRRADSRLSTSEVFEADMLIRWTKSEPWSGNPAWFDTMFSASPQHKQLKLGGGGLYAIFLDGQLLYVGIFVGPTDDLFGGSVLHARWLKHIGTLTMRGRNVSIRANALPLLRQAEGAGPLVTLRSATTDATVPLFKSQGMEMSRRKMIYAAERWDIFSRPMDEIFPRVSFGYARLNPGAGARWDDKPSLSKALKKAEAAVVSRYAPPLNTEHNRHPRSAHAEVGEVMRMLRGELDRLVGCNASAEASAPKAIVGSPKVHHVLEEVDEAMEAMEVFTERLTPSGAAFLESFSSAIISGDHFLYATGEGKEVRFCERPMGLKRHPLLLLRWGSRGRFANHFRARVRMEAASVALFGFKPIPVAASETQMHSGFNFVPEQHSPEALSALCHAAIDASRTSNELASLHR